jgi:hypothetical protein
VLARAARCQRSSPRERTGKRPPRPGATRGRSHRREASERQHAVAKQALLRRSGERPGELAQPLGLGPRRRRPARPLPACASAMLREALTSPPARTGRERRREVLDAAALRADAGQQEDRVGISSRARPRCAGAVAPNTAPTSARPQSRATPRSSTIARSAPRGAPPAASSRSWRSAAPGFEVRTSTNTPAPVAISGSSASIAEQRVGGEGVGAEPGDLTGRPGVAGERLRVGGGGHRHVAALAVGDHDQSGGPRAATTSPSAAIPGAPSRSKQASCGLTATQAGPAARSPRGSAR